MQLTPRELEQLADHIFCVIECSPEYEDDEFAFSFLGVRIYAERYPDNFRLELGHQDDVVFLPRA